VPAGGDPAVTHAVLLPSPFLPVVAYAPLIDALGRRGWGVVVATTASPPGGPQDVLTAYGACVAGERPDVVVAHSNAGRYAVAVAAGAPVVLVDAALPPESGEATLAPEALLDHLAGLADADGLLPPWTRWWPEEDLAAVVPDADVLAGIRVEEPRVPLSYVRSTLGGPARWQEAPQAYLALGETYADELAQARGLGWPTALLEGAGHLHHLVQPDAVAGAVVDLARRMGVGEP
jgi:Alpha/beta hydrolase family